MLFGMPTLVAFENIEENLAFAASLGLSFVELNMNLPFCTVDALKKTDLPALSEKYGISYTLHADENLFICDFNPRIADAHLQTTLDTISLCRANAIPLINFHMSPGVYFSLPDRKYYLFEKYEQDYQAHLIAFRDACQEAAGEDVTLCIENTGLTHSFILRGMDLLLHYPAFALTWDVGHDHSAGNSDSPFLMQHKDRIEHIHLHDALGKKNHLPLGSGEIDLAEKLHLVSPQRAVLEVKAPQELSASVTYLRNHLLE